MNKIVLSVLTLALLAVPVAAQNSVYLNPEHSSTSYCNTVDVEIWVNATNLGSGQINLTYDPDCANVTKWTRDTTNFPMGGESYYAGRVWITFMTLGQLTGDYMVGTLTIHCVNEGECKTPLAFADGSKLFDEGGSDMLVIWINGTFECSEIDTTPPSVTNPTATPVSIAADGIQTSQLNVTVTDDLSGVDAVTVDLSAIGGSPTQTMTLLTGDVYTTTTTAAVGTESGTYCLSVNATDTAGNSNTTECIELAVVPVSPPDTTPPSVTNPNATPVSIAADGIQTSQLNVTVTDDLSGVDAVTVDLSAIGGSPTQTMTLLTGDVYTTTTTAAVGTESGTYCLSVNATDTAGNSNTTECIELAVVPVSIENAVYLNPQHSGARYSRTAEVEIWVNATNFQSGQINLTYAPTCTDVTNCVLNTATFPISGWESSVDGREWITFMALSSLTGEYLIGTLTVHCVCEDECTTALDFVDPSALFDSSGGEISASWIDGTFECITGICGDVNRDSKVNMADVTMLFNNVTYGYPPLCDTWAADVNCDNKINMGDLTVLFNHVTYGDPLSCC
ncbi:MAG: dockerin type I domain-containing protein [Euryarchaeota archaeon]|nr:dockerin type I domain-containing protein [Euryarchaeota archaeon]